MASALDDLVATAVRTWATVARSWIGAANAILVGWLDVPDVESGRSAFNEGFVLVPAQQSPTVLSPESFSNWDDDPLPNHALAVKPAGVESGTVTEVIVSVQPPAGTASGTYTGMLCDSNGTCLLEDVGIYVVGDRSPP
jgi:hypothetical protein